MADHDAREVRQWRLKTLKKARDQGSSKTSAKRPSDTPRAVPLQDQSQNPLQTVVATAWSSPPIEQIESALPLLTLNAELLAAEGGKYWSLEGRNIRMVLRPIIATADRQTVMLLPRRTVGTRRVLGNYYSTCRLSWPYATLPSAVRDAGLPITSSMLFGPTSGS